MQLMIDGSVCGVSWSVVWNDDGASLMTCERGRLGFQNCVYFYGDKNALLPMGENGMDEKKEKDKYRS